jgi:Tfp pilus assembly protein PilO
MSHAVRNTLILLIVLILFSATGYVYLHYYQAPEIKELTVQLDEKKRELEQNQQVASQFTAISESYREASEYFNNYDKALYSSSNEDNVYDFLNALNAGQSYNNFNFAFTDSVLQPKYGVLNMEITGDGQYRNVVNFIRRIERSKPLNKVKNVTLTPILEDDKYNWVEYSFNLESYYDRSKILDKPTFDIFQGTYASLHNPFFPLVRDNFKPNTAELVDVRKSRLVALSTKRVFLIDQSGVMQQIEIGEKVYLGKLSSINLNNKTATFTLNQGGLVERETLKVNNTNN